MHKREKERKEEREREEGRESEEERYIEREEEREMCRGEMEQTSIWRKGHRRANEANRI